MSSRSIDTVEADLRNYFRNANLDDNSYEFERSKRGKKDVLTVYVRGTRKGPSIWRYGGEQLAKVTVLARSSESYRNGEVVDIESSMSQVPANIMRQVAEGKLPAKINGSNGMH